MPPDLAKDLQNATPNSPIMTITDVAHFFTMELLFYLMGAFLLSRV